MQPAEKVDNIARLILKIELEEPFDSIWDVGYLRSKERDGRKRLDLLNTVNGTRTTISYARYLVCVREGYILDESVEVDHKNNDCTDDRLENLQILTKEEHREKTAKENTGRTLGDYICAFCGCSFQREVYNTKGRTNLFCSRSCNGRFSIANGVSIPKPCRTSESPEVEKIRKLREAGLSDYKISDIIDMKRCTIHRIRKKFGIE